MIVALDDTTLNSTSFKRYQDISRCDYVTLLKNLIHSDVKAVAVDVFFSASSRDKECDSELIALLKKYPNIIVWTEYNEEKQEIIPLFDGKEKIENIWLVNTNGYHYAADFAERILRFTHTTDTRNSLLLYSFGQDISVLPIAASLYKNIINSPQVSISRERIDFKNNGSFPHIDGRMFINFFTRDYPTESFINVISNRFDSESFRGKTVFVGATSHDIHDEFYTPFDTRNFMPGVMIHANAYNTLSAGKPITYLPFWGQILLWLVFWWVITSLFITSASIIRWLIYGWLLLVTTIVWSAALFRLFWIFIEVFPLVSAMIFSGFSVYLYKFREERKSKNEIRSMFSKYVSADVANELIEKGVDKLALWWQEREVTLFFSDIEWFTDLSEKLSPEDLWRVMNAYFEEMSNIILSHRWTIDKFIGDAIMAFWNAPTEQKNHAELACRSALLQREALVKVREIVSSINAKIHIDMRIGLHSGKAVVGNFWSSNRFNYTAFGDTVNLASRLEGINKQYGTNIIISESTYKKLPKDTFIFRELDTIVVKGKTEPVWIYELIGLESNVPKTELQKLFSYQKALALYRDKKFKEAIWIFETIGDIPSQKFIERCERLLREWVGKDWDGVYRFDTK